MPSVTHLTSAHPRYDTRIFHKQCKSLSRNHFLVSLVVADGAGDELCDGIIIYDVGRETSRIKRVVLTSRLIFKKAVELDSDIYHIHDPELIPVALKLKKLGKIVIFDSHEDVPKQILSKYYLHRYVRRVLSYLFSKYESRFSTRLDLIVAATPSIGDKFQNLGANSIVINNFPIIDEFFGNDSTCLDKIENQIVYIGGLEKVRGIQEMILALSFISSPIRLKLAGRFSDPEFEKFVKTIDSWSSVDFVGWLDRKGIESILRQSVVGLVTLHPRANYVESLPVKMFEYMAAGIPVVASNFPYWAQIINDEKCGICVDPLDPVQIANAIDSLIESPGTSRMMGENGKQAIKEKYNWGIEESKLVESYTVLDRKSR